MSGLFCYHCMTPYEGENAKFCPKCAFEFATYHSESYHLTPGFLLRDRYMVGNVLGEGGFGITYVGMDNILKRKVAIKEFFMSGYVNRTNTVSQEVITGHGNKEEVFRKNLGKFVEEGQVLAKFAQEDGVVSIMDFFEENHTAYIVMEFLEGETLRQYCKRKGVLSAQEMLRILTPVMNALAKIHEKKLIHRDISPDNIMMMENGKVKLLDFGAAREFDQEDVKSLSVILKPGYAPEEQYHSKGKQGPWSDIYSLCATVYYCMTGKAPDNSLDRLAGDTVKPLWEVVSNCPDKFAKAIMKGMAVYQDQRFQNVTDLRQALMSSFDDQKSNPDVMIGNQKKSEEDVGTVIIPENVNQGSTNPQRSGGMPNGNQPNRGPQAGPSMGVGPTNGMNAQAWQNPYMQNGASYQQKESSGASALTVTLVAVSAVAAALLVLFIISKFIL